eukprot:CAMPEP_0204459418 /NCGR_PEP_ID=MMETSP0471-20130131/4120_1 /ASSEMBLY_ACC=CAM_ASM_000602 /TAXON_ID=2969 /ORGANISM="Oxyrrhis marina" /LENGTH=297 /DNA_ID=CAMNT_0051460169 /DNA_START=18 /DNA_END=910 /DNA_ORIENTATION=+
MDDLSAIAASLELLTGPGPPVPGRVQRTPSVPHGAGSHLWDALPAGAVQAVALLGGFRMLGALMNCSRSTQQALSPADALFLAAAQDVWGAELTRLDPDAPPPEEPSQCGGYRTIAELCRDRNRRGAWRVRVLETPASWNWQENNPQLYYTGMVLRVAHDEITQTVCLWFHAICNAGDLRNAADSCLCEIARGVAVHMVRAAALRPGAGAERADAAAGDPEVPGVAAEGGGVLPVDFCDKMDEPLGLCPYGAAVSYPIGEVGSAAASHQGVASPWAARSPREPEGPLSPTGASQCRA